jgi:hypothetical protein
LFEVSDLASLGALGLVSVEWLGLGWLSGVRFSQPGRPAALASWALRLLVGSCMLAVAELCLGLAGVGFSSIPLVVLTGSVLALAVRALHRPGTSASCEVKQLPVGRVETVGWLILGLVALAALIRSVIVPESGWDAYSHWGLRAQAFAQAGTLVDAHSEHEYYPPLVPLLEAWLYLHRGLAPIDLGKTVWAIVGGAFAVCLTWHLRLSLRLVQLAPWLAAAIVVGTTALLEGFWTGQADLPLTVYLSLATLAAWQWQRAPDRGWLIQTAIFAAAAALTKFEGLPRVGVLVVALLASAALSRQLDRQPPAWSRTWLPATALLVAAGGGAALWTAFELSHGIAPNGEHLGAVQPLAVGSVLLALLAVLGGVRTGGGLVIAALAWAVSARELLHPQLRLLTLVVVCQALATLLAFLLSATSPDLEVRTSATRLVEQFLPVALVVGALGLSRTLHL